MIKAVVPVPSGIAFVVWSHQPVTLCCCGSSGVALLAEWWNYFLFFGSGKQKLFLLQSCHDQQSLVDALDLVHDNIGSVPC